MPDRPTASRRAVLRTGVSLAAVGATTVTASSPASASHLDHQPAHVSLSYDKAMLKQYRPRLATGHLDFKPNKLYSWVAESPEHDTTVCVYCASYDAQHGLSPFAGPLSDSHDGDHEWFYVFVDTRTGDLDHIIYTAYHWLPGRMYAGIPTVEGTYPTARVAKPWHHYYVQSLDASEGVWVDLGDLTAVFEDWLDGGIDGDGMEEDLAPGAVVNPWTMNSRESWWRHSTGGTSFNELYVKVALATGLFGADAADLG